MKVLAWIYTWMVSKTQTLSNTLTILVSKICEILIIDTQMVSKKDLTSPILVNTISHATTHMLKYLSSSLSCKLHFSPTYVPFICCHCYPQIWFSYSGQKGLLFSKEAEYWSIYCFFFQCNLMLYHNFWPELSFIVNFIRTLCTGSTRIQFKTAQYFFGFAIYIYIYI